MLSHACNKGLFHFDVEYLRLHREHAEYDPGSMEGVWGEGRGQVIRT